VWRVIVPGDCLGVKFSEVKCLERNVRRRKVFSDDGKRPGGTSRSRSRITSSKAINLIDGFEKFLHTAAINSQRVNHTGRLRKNTPTQKK